MSIEKYKEILLKMDDMDRQGLDGPERDLLCDELDPYWYAMSPDERDEVKKYSCYLFEQWTPKEKYEDAVRVLETWPKLSKFLLKDADGDSLELMEVGGFGQPMLKLQVNQDNDLCCMNLTVDLAEKLINGLDLSLRNLKSRQKGKLWWEAKRDAAKAEMEANQGA